MLAVSQHTRLGLAWAARLAISRSTRLLSLAWFVRLCQPSGQGLF